MGMTSEEFVRRVLGYVTHAAQTINRQVTEAQSDCIRETLKTLFEIAEGEGREVGERSSDVPRYALCCDCCGEVQLQWWREGEPGPFFVMHVRPDGSGAYAVAATEDARLHRAGYTRENILN